MSRPLLISQGLIKTINEVFPNTSEAMGFMELLKWFFSYSREERGQKIWYWVGKNTEIKNYLMDKIKKENVNILMRKRTEQLQLQNFQLNHFRELLHRFNQQQQQKKIISWYQIDREILQYQPKELHVSDNNDTIVFIDESPSRESAKETIFSNDIKKTVEMTEKEYQEYISFKNKGTNFPDKKKESLELGD